MRNKIVFFGLMAAFSSLAIFGWGCNRQGQTSVQQPTPLATRPTAATPTTTNNVTPLEPQALAYLLLTQGAQVTVSRGGEQTQGISEMALMPGDTVEVTSGEARLLYPDAGMSVLEQGTKVTLVPDGEPPKDGVGVQLMLEAGKIWTRLERLLGQDENLSVNANDVVATVRGTGFGVQLIDGDVDVVVADHQVTVSTKTMLNTGKEVTESVLLAAGSGLRINPATIDKTVDLHSLMLKDIRPLSQTEKNRPEYLFGLHKLAPTDLVRPVHPYIWSAAMTLSDLMASRLSSQNLRLMQANILWFQQNQTELQAADQAYQAATSTPIRFMPPLRSINLLEISPTTTPTLRGPSS